MTPLRAVTYFKGKAATPFFSREGNYYLRDLRDFLWLLRI